MSANLSPYLNFRGQAREALTFYAAALDGELTVTTFAEYGGMGVPQDEQGQVMHGQVSGPDGLLLMGADVPSHMDAGALTGEPVERVGFSVSLTGDDEARLRSWWERLAEGATVTVPLEVAPWGDAFGMLVDRFGISWLVNIAGGGAA